MMALMWPVAFLAFLAHGEAENLLHPQSNLRQPTQFYKRLASKVDSLAAERIFNAQEQTVGHATVVASAAQGGALLKNWAAAHDSPTMALNAAAVGTELGNYALHLRDGEKLSVAAQVHAMMHAQVAVASEPTVRAEHSSPSKNLVASGGDLLKQWSASHDVPLSPPVRQADLPKVVQEMSAQEDSDARQVKRVPAKLPEAPKPAKAFTHAHDLMRDLDAGVPIEVSAGSADEAQDGVSVASGVDILANWDKAHDEDKASVRKELQDAASGLSVAAAKSSLESEAPADSVQKDLQSLRASMIRVKAEPASDKIWDDSMARKIIQEDRQNLEKAEVQMKSKSSHLHQAMHDIEVVHDVTPAELSKEFAMSDTQNAAGADDLEQWSKAHSHKKADSSMFKAPQVMSEKKDTQLHAPPLTLPGQTLDEEPKLDDVVKVQTWHASALHNAMRNIGSDAGDLTSVAAEAQAGMVAQEAGADTLEQWSMAKSHQSKKESMYLKVVQAEASPRLPSASSVPVPQDVEPTDVQQMQSSVSEWHGSALHERMRSIASDAPDVDMKVSGLALKSLEVAGVGELDQWSAAHKKPETRQFTKFMSPKMAMPSVSYHEEQVVIDPPVSKAPAQEKYDSTLHDAMRNMGSDMPDVVAAAYQPVDAVKADGADELAQWSQAHEKADSPKYMVAEAATVTAPVVFPVAAVSEDTDALRTYQQKLHDDSFHEKMRQIAGGVTDEDAKDLMAAVPAETLKAEGADALDAWSEAHKKKPSPVFTMPAALTPQNHKDYQEQAVQEPERSVENLTKQMHQSSIHEAMHSIGNDMPDASSDNSPVVAEAPVQRDPENDRGQGLMNTWSKSHIDKPKHKSLVDMYPPTPQPTTDILALAMSRGFGDKVSKTLLAAPVSTAGELHAAMHSFAGSTDDIAEAKSAPADTAASAGADILSQWSHAHK